jgi:uncharacterized protein with PQ loop repeat
MESPNPFAPSQTNSSAPQSWQAVPGSDAAPVRTTGLTVIVVVFSLFGILGILSGIGAVIAVLFEQVFQGMGNPDNNAFVKKIQDIQASFRIPGMILAAVNTLLSFILLIAAIGLATRKRWGWNLGRSACIMGLVFEVFRIVLGVAQQGYTAMSLSGISAEDLGDNAPPEAAQVMMISMTIGMVFGMIMLVVYAIGKMLVYFFSRRHLNKPEISALFD